MCHVLQYLCDCQVRHRIEAVVAFSDDFVACLQDNQRFRYNEVMLALNMSAALTAKKTKEFRSPPQEQVGGILFLAFAFYLNLKKWKPFMFLLIIDDFTLTALQ